MANNAARPTEIRGVAHEVNNICKKLQPQLNTLVEGLLAESQQTKTKNSYTETWELINNEVNGQCASAKTLIDPNKTPTDWGELHAKSVEYLQGILEGLPQPTNNRTNSKLETLKQLTATFATERAKAQKVINAIAKKIINYSKSSPTPEKQATMEQQLVEGAEAASEQAAAFARLLKELQEAQREPIPQQPPEELIGGRRRKTRKQKKRSQRSRHHKHSKKRYQ